MDAQAPLALDDLDRRIIAELQEDGRRTYQEIATRLGVAPGTARSRVTQLRERGVLDVIAVPNTWRMGLNFHATVGLRLEPGHADEVADRLAERAEISWVGLVSSGYDVLFEIALPDSHAFGLYKESLLAELPGVREADVFVCWDVRKFRYHVTPPGFDADTATAKST